MTEREYTARPLWTRWWIRERIVCRGFQWGGIWAPAISERCVPWWAWPFELLYRCICGGNDKGGI